MRQFFEIVHFRLRLEPSLGVADQVNDERASPIFRVYLDSLYVTGNNDGSKVANGKPASH